MARWYALDLAEQPVGPAFEAENRTHAYDLGCAQFGERCVQVQSVLSWEESERERKAAEVRRRKRDE
ncbi:MAG: hypothetical protein IPK12_23425 [Gemmatimonadetes bacterium]|nr:hypothetical protein [Gemmatimonadota bacterium]